jgi:hypothetical protein
MDPHPRRRWSYRREGVITIANEIPRGLVPRERLAELLGGPCCGGMGGDGRVHNASPLVRQDDQYEEEPTGDRRTTKKSAAMIWPA